MRHGSQHLSYDKCDVLHLENILNENIGTNYTASEPLYLSTTSIEYNLNIVKTFVYLIEICLYELSLLD